MQTFKLQSNLLLDQYFHSRHPCFLRQDNVAFSSLDGDLICN